MNKGDGVAEQKDFFPCVEDPRDFREYLSIDA
jgi:hypothetical protein